MRRSHVLAFIGCLPLTQLVQAQVTVADAGPDQDLCLNSAFLEGNAPANGETGVWTLVSGNLYFTDPTDPQTEVTGIAYGQNVLQWTITDGVETTSDLVIITLYEVDFPPADAGPDQVIVGPPMTAQLQATPVIFPFTGQWSIVAGSGTFADPTDPNTEFVGDAIGVNVLQWSCDYSPCGGIASDQVTIEFVQGPVTVANAGPDQELCDENAFLEGNDPGAGETGTWSIVSGLATIDDPTDPNSQITAQGPGVIVLRWTITDGTNTTTDDVAIWIYDADAPQAYGGEDVVIQIPQTYVVLQAGPFSWPTTCVWTLVAGTGTIGAPNEATTYYSGAGLGLNILQWTCDNGPCGISTDEVVITVEEAMALGWRPELSGIVVVFDPHNERLSITAPENIDRVIITDQMGRLVLDRSVNTRSASLDISQLPVGVYTLRAKTSGADGSERFAIVR
jgi:hypothetical protein